jgi:large subunit ribosomal protein L23|tara:strand:- start:1395 stop:1697 length:303 start_codon:yes stop_codon:yes gene_type:complete
MKSLHEIIVAPLLTEKTASFLMGDESGSMKYGFVVNRNSNKIEIKKAVEERFGVKVLEVNTSIVRGKMKRVRSQIGKTANWKKAYVKLVPGDKIAEFEGA